MCIMHCHSEESLLLQWAGDTSCSGPYYRVVEGASNWKHSAVWQVGYAGDVNCYYVSTTNSRASREVPSTEPAFFISLFSFLVSLVLNLLPQQMSAKKIALATTALFYVYFFMVLWMLCTVIYYERCVLSVLVYIICHLNTLNKLLL